MALQEIGAIITAPTVGSDGAPIPRDVLDARYHVNAAWPGVEPPEVFQAAAVAPATPTCSYSLPPPPPPVEPPVPVVILVWKGKVALREAGLLNRVEAAVQAMGGRTRDAWEGAAEWERTSEYMAAMAMALGLTADQIDKLFRNADAIQG